MSTAPLQVLQRYHRRALWCPALWIAGAGLALDQTLAAMDVAVRARLVTLACCVVAALVSRWLRRRPLAATAQWLDRRVGAQNRFEALAECQGRMDAMGLALADEAAIFARTSKLPRSVAWFGGVVAVVGLCLFVVLRGDFPIPGAARPAATVPASVIPQDEEPTQSEPIPAPELAPPTAELAWITPEPEARVAVGEDLALALEAETGTGLHEFVLYVRINDGPWQGYPQVLTLAAGRQQADLTLPLTALKLVAGDVVGYHLRAQRVRPDGLPAETEWPTALSPLQIARLEAEDAPLVIGGEVDAGLEAIQRALEQIRQVQGQVVRAVFALQHGLMPREGGAWDPQARETLARQETVQARLATLERPASVPPEAARALDEAMRLAGESSSSLRAHDVSMADLHAMRALVQLERATSLVDAAAREARARSAAAAATELPAGANPFDLDPREFTPAGWLERLALEQSTLADQLAARGVDAADAFGPQDKLAREIKRLAVEGALPAEVLARLRDAASAAEQAAAQLNESDAVAAIEPAARAAQELAEAATRMNSIGQDLAAQELLHAQQRLIHAAAEIGFAPWGERDAARERALAELDQLARALQEAAQREAARGSRLAAQALNQLARAANEQARQTDGPGEPSDGPGDDPGAPGERAESADAANSRTHSSTSGALMDLAEQAAEARSDLTDPDRERQRALQALKSAKARLEALKQKEKRAEDVTDEEARKAYEDAAAAAQQLGAGQFGEPGSANAGQADGGGIEGGGKHGRSNQQRIVPFFEPGAGGEAQAAGRLRDYLHALDQWLDGAIDRAERALREARRAHVLTTGNPAEAPPSYRSAVSTYFETLAREPAGPGRTAPEAR